MTKEKYDLEMKKLYARNQNAEFRYSLGLIPYSKLVETNRNIIYRIEELKRKYTKEVK